MIFGLDTDGYHRLGEEQRLAVDQWLEAHLDMKVAKGLIVRYWLTAEGEVALERITRDADGHIVWDRMTGETVNYVQTIRSPVIPPVLVEMG